MNRHLSYVALLFLLLDSAHPVSAQQVDWRAEKVTMSLHFGGSFGSFGPQAFDGPSLGGSLEFRTPYGLFAGRVTSATETLAFFPSRKPVEKNYDVGLLYGWRVDAGPEVFMSAAAGVSVATIVRRGEKTNDGYVFVSAKYERLQDRVIGLPVQARLRYGEGVGFSVGLFGNFNRVESYGGVLLGLSFGY